MWSFVTFFLKLLTDKITSKWLWIPLCILGMLYSLKLTSTSSYNLFITAFSQSILIIKDNWIALSFFSITCMLIYILLRKSNAEFEKKLNTDLSRYKVYNSENIRLIRATIKEEKKFIDDKIMIHRQIIIKNNLASNINYVEGRIIFFNYNIKVFEILFEEKNMPTHYGAMIFDGLLNLEEREGMWNEFLIKIEKIEYAGQIEESLDLQGIHFHRIYPIIPKCSNYRLFNFFRMKYELSWLNDQWNWKIKPWLLYYHRHPFFYYNANLKPLYRQQRIKHVWKRRLNQSIWMLTLFSICISTYITLSGLLLTIYNLILIWRGFLTELAFFISFVICLNQYTILSIS